MKEILIFSGTTEGRKLAEYLANHNIKSTVCVATSYGEEVMEENANITVVCQRMDYNRMCEFLNRHDFGCVVDATHPYAIEVTRNIKQACEFVNCQYIRLLRDTRIHKEYHGIICFDSYKEAAIYLEKMDGNILITTGSKMLNVFTDNISKKDRIYPRVLPSVDSITACEECGIEKKNIIAMQGPFGVEINEAMIWATKAKYLVTKQTGITGGFEEKLMAAEKSGCACVVIKNREIEEESTNDTKTLSFEDTISTILGMNDNQKKDKRYMKLVGIGMGTNATLTPEAKDAIKKADIVFGAPRIIESIREINPINVVMYKKKDIEMYLKKHNEYINVVVAFSGDTGFYSGAEDLRKIDGFEISTVCGISSIVYFASKLNTTWQDARLISAHGRECNIVMEVNCNRKVFVLLDSLKAIKEIGEKLNAGFSHKLNVSLGCNLSYEDEIIYTGNTEILFNANKEGLYIMYIENEKAEGTIITPGLSDDFFERSTVPMTKEEIREISICKLKLKKNSIVYDIGGGTGSVSVECARLCQDGWVYSIEMNEEAVELIQRNKEKSGCNNLEIIRAKAPQGLCGIKNATHAFIGGSSGNLHEIVDKLLDINSGIRVVINAVTIETIASINEILKKKKIKGEIIQVNISRAKQVGPYNLMQGGNPVYIISFGGEEVDCF